MVTKSGGRRLIDLPLGALPLVSLPLIARPLVTLALGGRPLITLPLITRCAVDLSLIAAGLGGAIIATIGWIGVAAAVGWISIAAISRVGSAAGRVGSCVRVIHTPLEHACCDDQQDRRERPSVTPSGQRCSPPFADRRCSIARREDPTPSTDLRQGHLHLAVSGRSWRRPGWMVAGSPHQATGGSGRELGVPLRGGLAGAERRFVVRHSN